MSLRTRLTILVSLCVAGAVVLMSLVAYFVTRDRLVSAVDETLEGRAQFVGGLPPSERQESKPHSEERGPGIASIDVFQVIDADGTVLESPDDQSLALPVSDRDKAVATGREKAFFRDADVDGEEYRIYTAPVRGEQAAQVARSLDEVNSTLADLRIILIAVSAGGVAAATILGLLVAHRSLRPVSRLTAAAEHVAATQDLAHSIEVQRRDEIGRLAESFNTMLRALAASREQQRQLVNDASHELRTPLTSLRTNVELLARDRDLDEEKREILNDAMFEIDELTKIVGELVDLAIDPRSDERERLDVRLDDVVEAVVARARRRTGLDIRLVTEPTLVVGSPSLLERAVSNVVDNACKWSAAGQAIDVRVRDGAVEVRDHGPGISPQDLPHVFNRFYRSADARAKPGSGLGLAIVKQIVEAHGGSVRVESTPGSGTIATLTLPTAEPEAPAEGAAGSHQLDRPSSATA